MELSYDGLELIKHFEGCSLEAYPDPGTGGVPWTIGYGSTVGVSKGMVITQEEAELMLLEEIRRRLERRPKEGSCGTGSRASLKMDKRHFRASSMEWLV